MDVRLSLMLISGSLLVIATLLLLWSWFFAYLLINLLPPLSVWIRANLTRA
jgi:hypothetical protein